MKHPDDELVESEAPAADIAVETEDLAAHPQSDEAAPADSDAVIVTDSAVVADRAVEDDTAAASSLRKR